MTAALLATLVAGGCKSAGRAESRTDSVYLGESFDPVLLTSATGRLIGELYVNMVTVSAEAARLTEDHSVREGSIRWRIYTATQIDRIRSLTDPRMRFAALWTLAAQMRIAFTEYEGPPRFGDQQYRYQDFARAFEKSVQDLGYLIFPESVMQQVTPEIERLARTSGVSGWFTPEATNIQRGPISQLLAVPLSPISGLQGVGDTPAAINRFTDAARDMTRVVDNLPERTRWQIELMMLEAQNHGAVAEALREFSEARKAIERISTELPQQTRELLADPKLAENIEKIQQLMQMAGELSARLDNTLKEFRQTISDVRQTVNDAQVASVAIGKAANEVNLMVAAIKEDDGDNDESATGEEGEKFRISDVTEAAVRIESAAAEIRKVIADIRAEGGIPAFDMGAQQANALVRNITLAAAVLIGLLFVTGVVLIVLWSRLHPSRRQPRA